MQEDTNLPDDERGCFIGDKNHFAVAIEMMIEQTENCDDAKRGP